jgi:uncharacterized OB-fold protein
MTSILDWTRGESRLVYQSCARCAFRWAFQRTFCPACGGDAPPAQTSRAAVGNGVARARTVVHRAPDDAFRGAVPYVLVLVDLDEGVRVMGHAAPAVAIGDRVRCDFVTVAGRLLPRFDHFPGDNP